MPVQPGEKRTVLYFPSLLLPFGFFSSTGAEVGSRLAWPAQFPALSFLKTPQRIVLNATLRPVQSNWKNSLLHIPSNHTKKKKSKWWFSRKEI